MSEERRKAAEGCVVAISVHLCLSVLQPEDYDLWIGLLAEAVEASAGCPGPMEPLRAAALELVAAHSLAARRRAEDTLRTEAQRYYRMAAAHRYEAMRKGAAA